MMKPSVLRFLAALIALATSHAATGDTLELDWYDVADWGVEGQAWQDQTRVDRYDRLPASMEATVREKLWKLSKTPAGLLTRFETDATEIWIHYELDSKTLATPNLSAMAYSGIDLYARDHAGKWRWVQANKPRSSKINEKFVDGLAPGSREYAAYFPLRNPVKFLKIGVPKGTYFKGLTPRAAKPIVFYGTSITHGLSASRPGMPHVAQLGRRLDRPVINLGFSGQGRMDPEIGELLAQIDAAVFVIDCLPNMNPKSVAERAGPLVVQLRAAHPETPIVLVEDRRYTNSWIRPGKDDFHSRNQAALKKAYAELKAAGVTQLHYIEGDNLLGTDAEGAADGSHPNDLGFYRQTEVFLPVLEAALSKAP